jgi:VWFA-related protein
MAFWRSSTLWLILPLAATGQQGETTLRTETRVVQVEVTVTDSHGIPVDGLRREDFTLLDGGKPRAIPIFSVTRGATAAPVAAPQPRGVFSNRMQTPDTPPVHSTIILLDAMNGWFENFVWARKGVIGLLDKLPPDERVAIYALVQGKGLAIVQGYTADHAMIRKNLVNYTPPGMQAAPVGPPPPGLRAPRAEPEFFMRQSSEAIRLSFKALAERLANVPGRKSVFWVSQGFPPAVLRDAAWDHTLGALNEANIAVSPVDSNGLGGPVRRWGRGSTDMMQEVAERTGGIAYFNRNDLDGAIAKGIGDSRASYTLGFYLDDSERDNKFHELKVRVNRSHVTVFHRRGYFAGEDPKLLPRGKSVELESALLSPMDSTDIGLEAKASIAAGKPLDFLNLDLRLETRTIALKAKDGGWTGAIEESVLETDERGNQLARVGDTKSFEVTPANRARYDAEGIGWPLRIQLLEGVVKVTVILLDRESGHIGSLTLPLAQVRRAEGN